MQTKAAAPSAQQHDASFPANTLNNRLKQALWFAARGWAIFPLHSVRGGKCTCGKGDCTSAGKHPIAKYASEGFKNATLDAEQIRAWWSEAPWANVGLATGVMSGVFALDVDDGFAKFGSETLEELIEQYGPLPETVTVQTGSGGRHFYFRHAPGLTGSQGRLGRDLDTRGDGGYVVAPGSVHKTGRFYSFDFDGHPDEVELAEAPSWIADLLRKPKARSGSIYPSGPIQTLPEDTQADTNLIRALASVLPSQGGFRKGHFDKAGCALGAALVARGYEVDRAATVVCSVLRAIGFPQDGANIAEKIRRRARRILEGLPTPQSRTLRESYPALWSVVEQWASFTVPAPVANDATPELLNAQAAVARIRGAVQDLLKEEGGGILALAVSAGTGKTKAFTETLPEILPDRRVAYVVQNHSLASEVQDRFQEAGVAAQHHVSVLSVRDEEGNPACALHEVTTRLAGTGLRIRREVCEGFCPFKEGCAAYKTTQAPNQLVQISQAAIAAPLLQEAADVLAAHAKAERILDVPHVATVDGIVTGAGFRFDDAMRRAEAVRLTQQETTLLKQDPTPLVVFDEPASLLSEAVVHEDLLRFLHVHQRDIAGEGHDALGHLAHLLAEASKEKKTQDGDSLRQALTRVAGHAEEVEGALTDARQAKGFAWARSFLRRLAEAAAGGNHEAKVTLEQAQAAHALGNALLECSHDPDAPMISHNEAKQAVLTHRAAWVRQVKRYVDAGGKIILSDATLWAKEVTAVFGDRVKIEEIHVRDAPCVLRVHVPWASGARSRHTSFGKPDPKNLRGVDRDAAERVRKCGFAKTLLIADKPTAEAIRKELEGTSPPHLVPELARIAKAHPGIIAVNWFGNINGLNCYRDCGLVLVVGDPWLNLGSTAARARALGLNPEEYAARKVMEQQAQAHARGRPVHRSVPLGIVQYGRLLPSTDVAPQWARCRVEPLAMGRPESEARQGWTYESIRADWLARGEPSQRAHARALDLDWTLYRRIRRAQGEWVKSPIKIREPSVTPLAMRPEAEKKVQSDFRPTAASEAIGPLLPARNATFDAQTPLPDAVRHNLPAAYAVGESVLTGTLTRVSPPTGPDAPSSPEGSLGLLGAAPLGAGDLKLRKDSDGVWRHDDGWVILQPPPDEYGTYADRMAIANHALARERERQRREAG